VLAEYGFGHEPSVLVEQSDQAESSSDRGLLVQVLLLRLLLRAGFDFDPERLGRFDLLAWAAFDSGQGLSLGPSSQP
jgi:hypothetical protein